MKKTSSLVWRFFDRLEENKRCVAVLCKLCDKQYKYFGNTTNLRTHLVNKHPIQWDLLQNGNLDESAYRNFEDDESTNQTAATPKRRKYVKVYKNENVDVLENSETDIEQGNNEDNEATINLVHEINENRGSDEEWLEDDWTHQVETYEPKRKMKYKQIKRELSSPMPTKRYIYSRKPSVTKSHQQPGRIPVENVVKKDEFSVFGEYIGNKLRKFKSYQTSVNVQQLITTILWQAEYGVYDNMESVKRVVLSTVQEMDTSQHVTHEEIQVPAQEVILEEKDQDVANQSSTESISLID
ncbi:unnamed protein product [Parnassius apollo]|uniref:(apollo) hypothetical protein n=1 Tax=Parnassius apollo TaxID=110799 RepID=A0A8S3Y4N7_PARAO|nr:unnamed protein product [Parnassius apollo]